MIFLPSKYTIENHNKIADEECEKNGLIRIENCFDYHKTFKAKASEGYIVYPSIRSLRLHKEPQKFSKSNQDTIYNIKLWIKLNNKEIELISEEYKGSLENLKWICKNNKCKGFNKEFLKCWKVVQKGIECPVCGRTSMVENKMTSNEDESLFKIHTDLCKNSWDYDKNKKLPNVYYPNSNKKVYWKCKECGQSIKRPLSINNVVKHGISCPICSDGISYPEKIMFAILNQIGVDFSTQKVFEWSKNAKHITKKLGGRKRYDFWIEPKNCIIETHGNYHYENSKWHNKKIKTLQEQQLNDSFKEKLAKDNNIKNYIVIDCRKSELEWIKNSIINSQLNDMFDLSKIDWLKAHKQSCKNITKEICELWNKNIDIKEICTIVKLTSQTIKTHLKKGSKIGWCTYNK